MSGGKWWSYLRNVLTLSPKPATPGEFPTVRGEPCQICVSVHTDASPCTPPRLRCLRLSPGALTTSLVRACFLDACNCQPGFSPRALSVHAQGVKVLGGTYVIDGDEVLFDHQDVVPGATPAISDVLAAAGVRA